MLRQIRYFQAVVRLKSFTEAAEECNISQSAISQQIQALEQELGVKLLHRENRRFELTPAGEHFYKKSLVLTADYEKMCRETLRIAGEDKATLRIGYLKGYGGEELHHAVGAFSEKYPDVEVSIVNGNHEELYDLLRFGGVDLVLNDQRRAFSDEYINLRLAVCDYHIELATGNPIAAMDSVDVEDLKNMTCILIASGEQRDKERDYYREIVGITGDFLFADTLEEGRLMAAGNKGYMPVECVDGTQKCGAAVCRIPLYRNGKPIKRHYCAFWKTDNSGYYVEEFADMLREQFGIEDPWDKEN